MAVRRFGIGFAVALALAAVGAPVLAKAPQRAEFPTPRPNGQAAAAPSAAKAAEPAAPVRRGAAFVEAAKLSGRAGFVVIDVETGEVLEALSAEETFPPASVAKAPTALYALETLGADHRFETRLVVEGLGPDGAAARVALVGGGDPELDSDMLAEMAAQAFARGLRSAREFVWDAGAGPELPKIAADQPVEVAYNPAVSPLTLNFNRVLLTWTRQGNDWALSLQARARSATPEAESISARLVRGDAPVFARADTETQEVWEINARAFRKNGQRWLPVRRPGAFAAGAFRALARKRGIALPPAIEGRAGPGDVLAFTRSRPLRDILQAMLRHSTNLTAEATGLAATRARGEASTTLAASGDAMSRWALARAAGAAAPKRAARAPSVAAAGFVDEERTGLGAGIAARVLAQARAAESGTTDGAGSAGFATGGAAGAMDLKNHSGLSAASRASPLAMARLLRAAALDGEGRARAGSLQAIMRPLQLEARKGEAPLPAGVDGVAKTGTMNFVRGLAGYLTAGSGRRLAFAIFSEDLASRAAMRDGRATGSSRAWLSRARALERKLVRAWCAAL